MYPVWLNYFVSRYEEHPKSLPIKVFYAWRVGELLKKKFFQALNFELWQPIRMMDN